MIEPHGGKLIERYTSPESIDKDLSKLVLNSDQLIDLHNIADGVYSPLQGFMNQDDFESVLREMRLNSGETWAIPIVLDVGKAEFKNFGIGQEIILENMKHETVGILKVESKYALDKDFYTLIKFQTTDLTHPGVATVKNKKDFALGGEIWLLENKRNTIDEYLKPRQTRKIFTDKNWQSVVGFQTRNPAHLAHEYIQKLALEFVDGIFINPVIGPKKSGDFRDELILSVYKKLINDYYPVNRAHLSTLPLRMNYAGPKEAVHHAIIRQNFGCTHFIVGRDHAGVGDFYDEFAAHRIFENSNDLKIQIMKMSMAGYCPLCGHLTTEKACPHGRGAWMKISGTKVRELVAEKNIEELNKFMRPEVVDLIVNCDRPFV